MANGSSLQDSPATVAKAAGQPIPPATPDALNIAADVSLRLRGAGRPTEEADAGGEIIAAHYVARAARFEGLRGTAADMYRAEAPEIVAGQQSAVVDAAKDRTLFQSAPEPIYETTGLPHLYSGLARAVNELTQAKGTGEQMLAMLNRTPGVKPEEMRWLGLDVWLRGQERASKEQIQDFMWANALQVREVVKGGASTDWDRLFDIESDARDRLRLLLPQNLAMPVGNGATTPEAVIHAIALGWARPDDLPAPYRDAARAFVAARADVERDTPTGGIAKYATHTLPGGVNYREVLITLPAEANTRGGIVGGRHVTIRDAAGNSLGALDPSGTYRSDHWDEPNVLAHVRLNERRAPDGKRVLLIEEIQSDWHQAGRKAGYGDRTETHYGIVDQNGYARGQWASRGDVEQYLRNPPEFVDPARSRIREFEVTVQGVPDAPFKTSWPTLAMKRMIAYAVDHGFDRVAWLPGDVQSERYNLAKHVDELVWYPSTQDLQAFKNGKEVAFHYAVPQSKLPDYLGKEVADRLLNAPTLTSPDNAGGVNHVLSSQDLRVGGVGMKGFYDTILPAETQKLVGKFGARVGTSEIPRGVTEQERQSIQPDAEALAKYSEQFDRLKAEAQDAHVRALMWGLGSGGAGKQADGDRADALFDRVAELRNTMIDETLARQRQPVHSFDVTADLRRAVLESGLTLFQENRGQIRFNDGGRSVITLFGRADASTFLHETAHEWLRELLRDAAHPQAPVSLTKDATTVREWLGADPDGPITRQQHERFARAFERYMMDGQPPSDALAEVFAKFREWLVSLYQTVERLGRPTTPEIRAVFDRMLTAAPDLQPVAAPAEPSQTLLGATGQIAADGGAADPQARGQRPRADHKRAVLDALLSGLREPGASPLWNSAVVVAGRLAAFEKRMTSERDEAAFQGAIVSGHAALDALQDFNRHGGAAVISRIRQATESHPDGLAGVFSEMRAGGRLSDLLVNFNAALDTDRALAGVYDRAAASLYRYGKDRAAVEEIIGRRPDSDAITSRFQQIDAAIGDAAAATPSRGGRSLLDDPLQKAGELLRRAVEAAAQPPTVTPERRQSVSASMGQ